MKRYIIIGWLTILSLFLLAACGSPSTTAVISEDQSENSNESENSPTLNNLEDLDSLQAQFNEDDGDIRLLLLLSPT